jgi:exodeoxyribonuclease V alpha subunit
METMTIAGFLRNVQIQDVPTLIVIDEASMLDLNLLYRIVLQSLPTTRILLCGDPDQLPPIGPGIPFSDIIRSRISSVIELDIVQRQDATTGIPEYSKDIRLGNIPELLSVGKIIFHEAHSAVDITEKCTQLLAESPKDSKVVAPTKDVTKTINLTCQAAINPSGTALVPQIHGEIWNTEYKVGDPILFTRNDYDAGVQNGSLARLVSVQPMHEGELGTVILDDTGDVLPLTKTFLDNMQLGYAMTLHKIQGSQVPRVIIALTESRLIDRSWIYTAITRSESEVHIVGAKSTFVTAVKKESAHHMRKTYLRELLLAQA